MMMMRPQVQAKVRRDREIEAKSKSIASVSILLGYLRKYQAGKYHKVYENISS